MKILKGGFVEMENPEGEDLKNKFRSYLENAYKAFVKDRVSDLDLDQVKKKVNDFCTKNNLQNKKVFTSRDIRGIFYLCNNFGVSITLDETKKILDGYLLDGKKISFMTLNSLMECMKPKSCGLGALRDFIGTYVHQSKNHSELDEEIKFFRNLDLVVDLEKESLDAENASAASFFSDWQSKIINMSNITDKNYMSINSLAIKLLEFKAKTKQYYDIKDIRSDILSYIEKIILLSQKPNNLPDNILALYFNALLNASIGNKEYKTEIFNNEFIQTIRNKILGDDKRRSNCYQIMFLFNLLKFYYDLYDPKELLEQNIFYGFYVFVFGKRNKKAIKKIVDSASDKLKRSIANHFLSFTREYVDNNSKIFKNFCEIFDLQIEKRGMIYINIESGSSQTNIDTIKSCLLDCYYLSQNEVEIKNIYVEEKVYGAKICIADQTYSLTSYTLKQKETIACNIKILSSYKKNSRAYEIFAATAFLIFGFISLMILKSVVDILILPIKMIINIFHSAIIAFKRKEYLWKFPNFEGEPDEPETEGHLGMFLHFLIDLIVGLLFIAFSPIICLYNNFFGSKYLFHRSGTGQKLITFNNWHFYKKQSDSDRAKNFGLTEINLWFVIKYIFGFACLAKSKDSELKMELKLTNNNQPDTKSSILKLSDKILEKHRSSALTNEYSPLSYLETIK